MNLEELASLSDSWKSSAGRALAELSITATYSTLETIGGLGAEVTKVPHPHYANSILKHIKNPISNLYKTKRILSKMNH